MNKPKVFINYILAVEGEDYIVENGEIKQLNYKKGDVITVDYYSEPFKQPLRYAPDLDKLGKYLEGKKVGTIERRIWTLVILSCIGLAILGLILWGNFMANMYAGNI